LNPAKEWSSLRWSFIGEGQAAVNSLGLDDGAYLEIAASPYARLSFAQEAEDLIFADWFATRIPGPGFYVDIGAYHPQRFSNTYIFYLMGWRGINVDATPGSMGRFHQRRPGDINLEYAVSDNAENLTHFIFEDGALNTVDPKRVRYLEAATSYRPVETRIVTTIRLDELLERHLPRGQGIDFLTVDVEDMDERVLRSNDWIRFRPAAVIAEDRVSIRDIRSSMIDQFLGGEGYRPIAKLPRSALYVDARRWPSD